MLRAASVQDLTQLLPLANDPDVRPWIFQGQQELTAPFFVQAMIAADQGTLSYPYVIIEAEEIVGFIALQNVNPIHRRGELTKLAVKKMKGRFQIGKRAGEDLLHIAFYNLNLNRVESLIYSTNSRLRPIFRHTGTRHEGTARQAIWHNGKFIDLEMWAITCGDWLKHRAEREVKDAS